MKIILALVLLAGAVMAPGYYVYCTFFSGKCVGNHSLFTQEVSQVGVGGFTHSSSSGASWTSPAKFELSPEMNPVSVTAKFTYLRPKHITGFRKSNDYLSRLSMNDQVVWREKLSLSVKKDGKKKSGVSIGGIFTPTKTAHVKTFTIDKAGSYELHVKQTGKSEVTVANIEMAVRRNVQIPNMKIVIGGGVAILLSIVGFVILSMLGDRSTTTNLADATS